MRQSVVQSSHNVKVAFAYLGKRGHIGNMEGNVQLPAQRLAPGALDGRGTDVGTHNPMTTTGQSNCLRSDTAGAIEDVEPAGSKMRFQEGMERPGLPFNGPVPIFKDQMVVG